VEAVTRPASSSPSVGTVKRHMEEQKALIDRAFASVEDRQTGTDY
jgi:2-oxoglutarate dehydrogenase E1 component